MAIKIFHTADTHLGTPMSSFGELAEQRRALLRRTFLDVCDLAISKNADLFLCAGDIFDSVRPEQPDIETVKTGVAKLQDAQIPAFAIPGGHDGAGTFLNALHRMKIAGLTILGGQEVFAPYRITINDQQINIYALTPTPGRPTDIEVMCRRDLPGFHIGLLHASVVPEGLGDGVPSKDIPVTERELAALDLDYIALGHYHNYREVVFGDRTIGCYPGTIEAKRFSETGPRCVAVVTLTEHGLNLDRVQVGSTIVEQTKINVEGLGDLQAVIDKVSTLGGEGKLARITLTGILDDPIDPEAIQAAAADQFDFLFINDNTEISLKDRVRSISKESTVRGLATKRLLERFESAENQQEELKIKSAMKYMLHQFEIHSKKSAL